jgi:hypothetical protein
LARLSTRRPGHRHTALTVTTLNKLDGYRSHRGYFGSWDALNGTR